MNSNRTRGFTFLPIPLFCVISMSLLLVSSAPVPAFSAWSKTWVVIRDSQEPFKDVKTTTNVFISPTCRALEPSSNTARMVTITGEILVDQITIGRCSTPKVVGADSATTIEIEVGGLDVDTSRQLAGRALGDKQPEVNASYYEAGPVLNYHLSVRPVGTLTWGSVRSEADVAITIVMTPAVG